MKKSSMLTVGLFVISIGLLNAQTTKGKYLLELSSDLFNLGYTNSKSKSDEGTDEEARHSFNIGVTPAAGYFVIDNLALGISFNIGLQTSKSGDDNNYTLVTSQIGPFVRYYVPTTKVLPFFELGGSIGSWAFDGENKTSITRYGGGVGLAAPLGDRVMADFLLGYHSIIMKAKEDNENNYRTVQGTLGLSIGFTILLGSG